MRTPIVPCECLYHSLFVGISTLFQVPVEGDKPFTRPSKMGRRCMGAVAELCAVSIQSVGIYILATRTLTDPLMSAADSEPEQAGERDGSAG